MFDTEIHLLFPHTNLMPTHRIVRRSRAEPGQEVKIFVKGRRLITNTHCKEFANFGLLKNTSIIDRHIKTRERVFNLFLGYPIKILSFDKYFQACKS